jgi:siroheme synthase-like protein
MKYLPIGLDVRGRPCVVVGGGDIGTRKVLNLLRAGARVTLISPEATDELVRRAEVGELVWLPEEYHEGLLHGAFLAVAATDDEGLNASLVEAAGRRGILVCDASSAERSQVIFGALHEGEGVTVAVFTDGRDPSLARKTRDRIRALDEGGEAR